MSETQLGSRFSTAAITLKDVPQSLGPLLLLPGALLIWFWSVSSADLQAMTDLGLISVLPPTFFVGVVVVSISYALSLHSSQPKPVLILHIAVLIFMLFGVAPLLEGSPRTSIAWKLVGIMDYVARQGTVDPGLDAFHNWPGFFILVSFLSQALGLPNAMPLAMWAPLFFNLLYLAPLYLLFSSGSSDERVKWLGIWFFYLANWIGQDYLAPQALGYLIYLLILAILLRWFRVPDLPGPPGDWERLPPHLARAVSRLQKWLADYQGGPVLSTPRQRLLLIGVVIFLYVVVVPSHQLSPVAIAASTIALVVMRRITPRTLPILMVVLIGVWLSYMTVPFLSGHLDGLLEPLGNLGSNVQGNVTNRLRGSPDHVFVVRLRIGVTLLLWGLALLGFLRRRHNGYRDVDFALLAVAPLGLLALATYGGELVLRIYLFSLPFMVFFVATLFYPTLRAGKALLTPLLIVLLSAVFILAFFVTRYGNERMDYFTEAEIAAIEVLYETAPPGSLLASATDFLPWRYRDYEVHQYVAVERQLRDGDLRDLNQIMLSRENSYLILTRSQEASTDLFWGWPEGLWEETVYLLLRSNRYQVVYENEDGIVFRFVPWRSGAKEGKQ